MSRRGLPGWVITVINVPKRPPWVGYSLLLCPEEASLGGLFSVLCPEEASLGGFIPWFMPGRGLPGVYIPVYMPPWVWQVGILSCIHASRVPFVGVPQPVYHAQHRHRVAHQPVYTPSGLADVHFWLPG